MPTRTAAQPPVVGRMLGRGVVASLLGAVLAAAGCALLMAAPGPAALNAALAGLVVTACFGAGLYAVSWLLTQDRAVVMPGAFMILVTIVLLLTAFALAFKASDWVLPGAFAAGALTSVVLTQIALVHAYLTGPRPFLDVDLSPAEAR